MPAVGRQTGKRIYSTEPPVEDRVDEGPHGWETGTNDANGWLDDRPHKAGCVLVRHVVTSENEHGGEETDECGSAVTK